MRAIVDIPAEDLTALDLLARRNRWSRAEAVRQSVRKMLADQPSDIDAILDEVCGSWAHLGIDGLAHQQALRAEWDDRSPE